ncbi:MAG: hypothetical protein DRH33_01765 [Candidatus Nealsonbacteria bacterium]|nr:MAG: hypothetical protein DRH33_01765 [Candidatus Nealsonbacteria bacterium]
MSLKKIVILTLLSVFLGGMAFLILEPLNLQAATDTVSVSQSVVAEINVNCSSTATLPNVNGQTGGTATTTFGCTVESSNASGWTLAIKYDHKLYTDGGGTGKEFDEYTTSTIPADYDWDPVGAGNEEFGFNVHSGANVVSTFADNGVDSCGSGSPSAWHCFYPISTTDVTIADSNSPTAPSGENYVIGLQDEVGSSNNLQSGSYSCTITATATNK